MKCEKIQEIILTDYLDNTVDQKTEKSIQDHLNDCDACREFLALAVKSAVEPFQKAKRIELSQKSVWDRIKEEIQNEEEPVEDSSFSPGFCERLRQSFFLPQRAYVFATVLAFVLVFFAAKQAAYFQKENEAAKEKSQEVEYIAYLLTGEDQFGFFDENGNSETELNAYYL